MKKSANTLIGTAVLLATLFICLAIGFAVNNLTQMGVCLYGKGIGSFIVPDLMGGVMEYAKMPYYQDWQITPLAGGLAAGLFFFLSFFWLIIVCSTRVGNRHPLLRKFEFSIFAVGIGQILYGFGRLILLLTDTALTGNCLMISALTLGLGIISALILYRKEFAGGQILMAWLPKSGEERGDKEEAGCHCQHGEGGEHNCSGCQESKSKKLADLMIEAMKKGYLTREDKARIREELAREGQEQSQT